MAAMASGPSGSAPTPALGKARGPYKNRKDFQTLSRSQQFKRLAEAPRNTLSLLTMFRRLPDPGGRTRVSGRLRAAESVLGSIATDTRLRAEKAIAEAKAKAAKAISKRKAGPGRGKKKVPNFQRGRSTGGRFAPQAAAVSPAARRGALTDLERMLVLREEQAFKLLRVRRRAVDPLSLCVSCCRSADPEARGGSPAHQHGHLCAHAHA